MLVPAIFSVIYCILSFYKTDTSLRRTTDTLKYGTDSKKVLFILTKHFSVAMFNDTQNTFTLVNSLNYSINVFSSVVKILRFLVGDRSLQQINTICFAWNQIQTAINKFVTFSLNLLHCQQQTSIYWPYSQVDNYVGDWCHIASSLYKTDTSWQLRPVPKVSVLERFDCTTILVKTIKQTAKICVGTITPQLSLTINQLTALKLAHDFDVKDMFALIYKL